MDNNIREELFKVLTSILKKIQNYVEDEKFTKLYSNDFFPICYEQIIFTYYFIKYIEILNFFILGSTLNLNEIIQKIKTIVWYSKNDDDDEIRIEYDIDEYSDYNEDDKYKIIKFINDLNIDNITDFSKFKFLNKWFIDTLDKFEDYKFRVYFNGTIDSNNVNDYILIKNEKQYSENKESLIPLFENMVDKKKTLTDHYDINAYNEYVEIKNKIDEILKDSSNYEIFDISELQNIFSSFEKGDKKIEINDIVKKNNKILIDLLYFINNGQINTRQDKKVQEILNSIISKIKELPDTNTKITDIIRDVFSLSLTSNRIGNTFNNEELRILNMQNQASETLKNLIITKVVKQGDYFISSTTGDIRDSTIYLLENYNYSVDKSKLYVSIIGLNPLNGEKEKMHFDILDSSLELSGFFDKCDYIRLKNMKEITPKDKQNIKILGKYAYKI